MKSIRWSAHALYELERRQIDADEADITIREPSEQLAASANRRFHQRRYFDIALQSEMLMRVLLEETEAELVVVTLYKTSKFEKYERGGA